MKKTLTAIFVLTSSFVAQAETVTYNASSCHVKYGNAEKNYSLGVVENRSGDYDVLTCNLPIKSNRTVGEVNINVYADSTKVNSQSSCNISLLKHDAVSVLASGSTDRAENGKKNTLVADLNTPLFGSARGRITCSIGAVEDGGLVRFTSYSVSYSD